MIIALLHVVVLSGLVLWQVVVPPPGSAVLGTQNETLAPTPAATPVTPAAAEVSHPIPTPTPTSTPTPTVIVSESDDCNVSYHYDSRENNTAGTSVNITRRCKQESTTTSSVNNTMNMEVNTGSTTSSAGNVNIDVSVKNKVE